MSPPKADELAAWCRSAYDGCTGTLAVGTPGGPVLASDGDWIIRDPDGTFHVAREISPGALAMDEPAASDYVCPACERGQCFRGRGCQDDRCTCCGGSEG